MLEVTVLCQSVAVSRSEVQWSCMMLFTGVSEDSIPHNLKPHRRLTDTD